MTDLSGQSIGRYHLLEPLGRGGMAVVYKSYDTRLEREVAVKLIRMDAFPAEVHDRVLGRFEREAKALAKLSHPGIVNVFDYGDFNGAPYLVMELLAGGTLKERTGAALPWPEAVGLVRPVAEALAYAHGHGILHRDVKPSNILLTADGRVVLTDFGIAKLLEGESGHTLTGTGMGVGTPEYMAPEQGFGGEVDGRADVYSLGVVLFELVTGQKPYVAETPLAVILKQVNDPLPRPRELVADLPEGMERVLLKALAKKPEDRYEDMGAFAAVLKQLAGAETLAALVELAEQETPVVAAEAESAERAGTGSHRNEPAGKAKTVGQPVPEVAEEETRDELEVVRRIRPRGDSGKQSKGSVSMLVKVGIGVGLLAAAGMFLILMITGVLVSTNRAQQGNAEVEASTEATTDAAIARQEAQTATAAAWTATPAFTETPSFTATPEFGIGSTRVRETDGMVEVYVPAGTFLMGSTTEDPDADDDEFPQHEVYLDEYWIDRTEVTNGMYAACAEAGSCWENRSSELENPVVSLSWFQAQAYCEWVGGRLPTEAEWEKAARGVDGRLYPWGNEDPICSLANYRNCVGYTAPVGSYLDGASPYGALDMAGNVWEWVADWYDDDYYDRSPDANPAGPTSGEYRVLRGGSSLNYSTRLRVAYRSRYDPWGTWHHGYGGFRCVRSP